jgi:hypothetical protein
MLSFKHLKGGNYTTAVLGEKMAITQLEHWANACSNHDDPGRMFTLSETPSSDLP